MIDGWSYKKRWMWQGIGKSKPVGRVSRGRVSVHGVAERRRAAIDDYDQFVYMKNTRVIRRTYLTNS